MRNKQTKERTQTTPVKHNRGERNPQFETPSQKRNRDGLGREHNGSDGGSTKGRGSNH